MDEGHQEGAREEREECEGSEQRLKKNDTIEEVLRSSQRMAWEGHNPIQRWDCSQIQNEEESWQEGDRMAKQPEEEQRLEDANRRRRMEGSSLKLAVIQKVPELVVNGRMSQGER